MCTLCWYSVLIPDQTSVECHSSKEYQLYNTPPSKFLHLNIDSQQKASESLYSSMGSLCSVCWVRSVNRFFIQTDVCFLLSSEISFVPKFCCKEIIKKHKKSHQAFKYFKMHLEYTVLRWYKFYWFLSLNIIFVKWIGHMR